MGKMFNSLIFQLTVSILFLCSVIIISIITSQWVVLSLGVGFLFGFAIQKGDLCGSSAMSEVILMKDTKKIFGFWIAILTSMVLFAIFKSLGVIQLAPKKLIWLSAIVGGAIFGVGTVLAGGCISGCMYKAATGNINSIAAMLTIPIGISFVDFGPLKELNNHLLTFVINDSKGNPITLHSLLGVPYWLIVLILFITTLAFILFKKRTTLEKNNNKSFKIRNIFEKSWKPWQAGIVIGFIAMLAWLSSLPTGRNYPLGVTHGVNYTYQAIIDRNVKFVYEKPKPTVINKSTDSLSQSINKTSAAEIDKKENLKPEPKKLNVWLIFLSLGFVFGSFISGKLSGQAKLLPKEPSQTVIAMFGGFLIGVGAAIASGCIIGNILSGWAMLSIGMFIFGITTLLANWLTAYFYLMGGSFLKK